MRLLIIAFLLSFYCNGQVKTNDSLVKVANEHTKRNAEENAKKKAQGLPYRQSTPIKINDTASIFSLENDIGPLQTLPDYPGLNEFIDKNLDKSKGCVGKVYVEFLVDKNGIVQNPIIAKGLSPNCNQAAIAVVNKFQKFSPAIDTHGKPTHYRMLLPINFK